MHGSRAALVLAITLAARSAAAQETAPTQGRVDHRAHAQQLFDSALADAEAGNLSAACPKFQASQDADPKPSTLLNLASCYEKNGQTASAWGAFREAEGLARKSGRTDWESTAHARAEALEPKLVRLTVQVPEASRSAGLVITRDGARLATGEWGIAIPVDPGEHTVAANADGKKPWETHAALKEQSVAVSVPELEAAEPEAAAPIFLDAPTMPSGPVQHPEPSWWTPMRKVGVAGVGFGALGILTGSVLGLVANGRYQDAKSECSDGTQGCPDDAVSDAQDAHSAAAGATVVFIVGAALAATGVTLILLGAPKNDAHASSTTTFAFRAGPRSAGLIGTW